MFDPSSSSLTILGVGNWVFLVSPFVLISWAVFGSSGCVYSLIVFLVSNMNSMLLQYTDSVKSCRMFTFLLSIFLTVFLWNELGLVPYGFGVTSQLVVNLSVGLTFFILGVIIYVVACGFKGILSHIVPFGAPMSLSFVLVFVETISFLIRPFTLAVRLVGNIVTGHLLIALLCELGSTLLFTFHWVSAFVIIIGSFLLIFEVAVSLVQAVIFIVLIIIYWTE